MDEPPLSAEQQARNRRLFGGMVRWLFGSSRPPGMVGVATAFVGKAAGDQARLDRTAAGWRLRSRSGEEDVDLAGVLRLVGTGEFFPQKVEIVPDLAAPLFQEAVNQAEQSVLKLRAAEPHIADLAVADEPRRLMAWVLATTELDRAVRAGITSVVLAIASAEAQANAWAATRGGWSELEDRMAVAEKCVELARRAGVETRLDEGPFQRLQQATKRRNSFVHSKPTAEAVPVFGSRAPTPGRSVSIEARATCLAVRRALVELARELDIEPPKHLAYCPDVEPADDDTWATAGVLTGVRRDSDFPVATDRDA